MLRRKQRRASFRLSTDLVAILDDQPVHVIDLAVQGMGVHVYAPDRPFDVGQKVSIILRVPTNSGDEQSLAMSGEVRSVVVGLRDDDPEALLSDYWQAWTIDLAELAGVDLGCVKRLTLGIGDLGNPRPGAERDARRVAGAGPARPVHSNRLSKS